jgi:hypothetical protein
MTKLFMALAVGGVLIAVTFWLTHQTARQGGMSASILNPSSSQQVWTQDHVEPVAYQAPLTDKSELDLAVDEVAILSITDSAGRRTGRASSTSAPLQEIPRSTYFEDSLADDTGVSQEKQINHFINIAQPETGRYVIVLTGLKSSDYRLSIRAFSRDGKSQPEILKTGHLAIGAQIKFALEYTPATGSVSSATEQH